MPEYFYADRLFNALERVDPEPGMLLIAAPGMLSPDFARTVVLVLEHDADHTLGVVLNRRSEVAVANVMVYLHGRPYGLRQHVIESGAADLAVTFVVITLVDCRAYPLFVALFGYGWS